MNLRHSILAALLGSGVAAVAMPALAQENCKDADRVPITWSTIAGFYTDAMDEIKAGFESRFCARVQIVPIDNSQLYAKQVIELVGQTGAYDVITLESAEKAEFAENGWILPLTDFLKAGHQATLDDVAPALRSVTMEYDGQLWGLPYYSYTAGMTYRKDLFEDETEKAAFKARYGYDLAVPTDWKQHRDIAEFFTRKAGDKLKGQPLAKDFYGVGLMAGPFSDIQDEMSAPLWGGGNDWFLDDGTVPVDAVEKVVTDYVALLPFAPPSATTVTYDGVDNQMADGLIAMTHGMFLDQFPTQVKVEDNVPGAELAAAPAPGGIGYVGAFLLAVSKTSKHPELAKEFVAYMGSRDAQMTFARAGGTTTLMSVLSDPQITAPENRKKTGAYPVLYGIFNHLADVGFKSNLFYNPFGAKFYSTMQIPLQGAAVGQLTPRQAAENLAQQAVDICGGPCPIKARNGG